MDNFIHEYTAMSVHKSREQELLAIAEKERNAKALRETISQRVRRVMRNNNPAD